MKFPEKVLKVLQDESSVKTISTISKDGELHSVSAGSLMAMGEDKLFIAEIFMSTTSKNIQANPKVACLVTKGTESYLMLATAEQRDSDGDYFEVMTKAMRDKAIPVRAIWTFNVDEIYDQSAAPTAGTKLS